MAGGKGNIDAISVSLGVDLSSLRSDLRKAKSDLDTAFPPNKTMHVSVNVTTPNHAVTELYKDIRGQFDTIQKGQGANALRIAPRMTVDPRVMRDFRRDLERNMMQAGRSGQALRVPIRFNGDTKAFIASIGHIEVPVYGKWAGWSSGGGPPESMGGGGGGGGGGRGPSGGHPFSGFRGGRGPAGGGPAPKPARGKPAGATASGSVGGTVVPPHVYARSGGVETSSSDRYETEAPPGRAPRGTRTAQEDIDEVERSRRSYVTPGISGPGGTTVGGAKPPTARQQRQASRRASMSGAAPPPSTPRRNVYGPGNRATTGASTNPRYTEPPGGRITVDNVRSGSTIEELQGEERAAFISQTRAGGRDFSPNAMPQATSGGRPTTPRAIERLERRRRYQAARARGQSPADIAAREHIRTGFHQLDPDLAAAFDIAGDPESRQGYGEFLESAERAREAYGTAFHGMDKKTRRQRGIARGYKKGDINAVDPTLLLFDASLDALREMQRSAVDPLYQVRSGDTKGRGPGGKVGKIGGRSAGRMASASVNPAAVQAIIERRRIGGKGNGWKTLKGEFSAEEISAAVGRIGSNKDRPEVEDIEEGKAYGGGAEMHLRGEAPPIQGGQGAGMRPDPKPRKQATYQEFMASSDVGQAGRARTPVGSLHEDVGGGTSVRSTGSSRLPDLTVPGGASGRRTTPPPRAHGPAGPGAVADERYENWGVPGAGGGDKPGPMPSDARSHLPPPPERGKAYGRNQDYSARGTGKTGHGGSAGFFEFLKNFRGTSPGNQTYGPRHSARVQKLIAMAGTAEYNPEEAENARRILRRRGIPGFADGGLVDFFADGGIPPKDLRAFLGKRAPETMPRPGSRERTRLEQMYSTGMRGRTLRAAKPLYQQSGSADPRWRALANAQFEKDPFCAYCGKQTVRGAGGAANAFRGDHAKDVARGGAMYDPENIVTACNSCNSYKSGGKSARTLGIGQRTRLLGPGKKLAEGGLWNWGGSFAEGGVVKRGGLLDRMAQSGHQPSIAMVGERGPELLVSDPGNGETEVVPAHKVPTWLQRAQEGKGLGKAMDHHADGNTLRFRGGGPSGRAHYVSGASAAGAAVSAGMASPMGSIMRVAVTNWPPSLTSGGGGGGGGGGAAQGNPAQAHAAAPGAAPAGAPPAPGPGAVPNAPPVGAGRARRGPVDPYARVRAREVALAGEGRAGSRAERIQEGRAESQDVSQRIPVRATSVSFGQIAQQGLGGRGDILQRQRAANVALARAQRAEGVYTGLRQAGAEQRAGIADITSGRRQFDSTADRTATLNQARDDYQANIRARQEAGRVAESRTVQAEEKQSNVLTRGQQFRSQAAGLGGIIAGTAVFSTAIAAFTAATSAAATVLDPLVQTMLGWPAAIDKVTSSIRDSITASNGQVRAGTAAAVAPSGISASYLDRQGQNFSDTGMYRAAETAAAQALEISRAGQKSRAGAGLYEGVGGVFGTNVATELTGGQPGFLQDIEKRLKGPLAPREMGEGQPGGFENPASYLLDKWAGTNLNPMNPVYPESGQDKLQVEVDDLNKGLANAAEYAGDAANAFQLVTNATDEQKQAMIDSAKTISEEARTRAEGIAATGVAVVRNGEALDPTSRQFEGFGQQAARAQLIQDPQLLLRATQSSRNATMWGIQANANFQRTEDLPAAAAMRRNAQPFGRIGAGYDTSGIQGGQPLSADAKKNQADTLKATQAIQEYQAKGTAALESIVARNDRPSYEGGVGNTAMDGPKGQETIRRNAPGPALTQFRSLQGQIGGLGQQIQTKVDTVQQAQATLQAHEYGEQLRLANRSLGDAQDLWAGINGESSNTLGGLQAQNMMLDRQNQLLGRRQQRLAFKSEAIGFKSSDLQVQLQNLGFQQSQRQINFNKSVAGFAAPGSTPEERAARIQEAKLEADFAQKQLNLQIQIAAQGRAQLKIAKEQSGLNRAQFSNQNQQQDNAFAIAREEAQRSVTDLQAQVQLLGEGHTVAIDTAAAEEAIARLQEQQGILIDQAQSYVTTGQEVRGQVLADIQHLMAETNKGFDELVSGVAGAWNEAFQLAYQNFFKPVQAQINALSGAGGGGGGGGKNGRIALADGMVGTTAGPTQFLAGEAGREHVVVLRNTTSGTMQMGLGGGGGTTINVGGVVLQISGAKDMDESKLADAVVNRLSRKLSLIAR